MKLLLVCEGPTDIKVISKVTDKIKEQTGNNAYIQELSPQTDKTTSQYPSQGWSEVRSWCKRYSEKDQAVLNNLNALQREAAKRLNWKAIIAASSARGLIIQMDTDIAEHIKDLPNPFDKLIHSRRAYCEDAIKNWLNIQNIPGEIYLLLTSYSTETWLLSTYSRSENVFVDLAQGFDFESIDNAEDRLIMLGFSSKNKDGKVRLDKKQALYDSYGDIIVSSLNSVRHNCLSAEEFCTYLESL